MNKNIIFIPNIDMGDGRNSPYQYSVLSWQKWAKQYDDIEVIEWTDPIMDPQHFKITYQRYWVHDILKHNEIEYNQVLIVDADTIVHPNCPNFFKESNNKFGVVANNGSYEWVIRSIDEWGNALFPNEPKVKTWKYFNGGFQITNKEHIPFYLKAQEYYSENIDLINKLDKKIQAGTDQTIINYLAQQNNIPMEYMPECYNLQDLQAKSLLGPRYGLTPEEILSNFQPNFICAGWIYHFNAIPVGTINELATLSKTHPEIFKTSWIETTYNVLYK